MKNKFLSCLAAVLFLSLGASAWAQTESASRQIWSKLDQTAKSTYVLGYGDGLENGCKIASILSADADGKSNVPPNCAQAASLKINYNDAISIIDEIFSKEKYAGLDLDNILFLITLSVVNENDKMSVDKEKLFVMLDEALVKR